MTTDEKRFYSILAFAVLTFISGVTLLAFIIFGDIPAKNEQMANVALGFIMNTLISTVLLYFFGGTPTKKSDTTTPVTGDNTTVVNNTPPTP